MARKVQNKIVNFIRFIWSLFLNGLLAILPLALTIAFFNLSIRIVLHWIQPIRHVIAHYIPSTPKVISSIPYNDIILALIGILVIGALTKFFLFDVIIKQIEKIFTKIPLVSPIYSGMKQLVHAFKPDDKLSFKQVVLVEFPRKGMYSVGFLTSIAPASLINNNNQVYVNIFVPTTPNPTTGYFIMVAKEEVIETELTRQEAMALIISGGIIQPQKLSD